MGKARDLADLVNKQSSDYVSLLTKNGKEARIRIATDIATEAVLTLNQAGALTVKENGIDTLYTIPDLTIANIKPPSNFEVYDKNNLPTAYKGTGHRYLMIVDGTNSKILLEFSLINGQVDYSEEYSVNADGVTLTRKAKSIIPFGSESRLKLFINTIANKYIIIESDTDKTILQDKMKVEDIRLFDIEGFVELGNDKITLPTSSVCSFQYYKGKGVEGFFYTIVMRNYSTSNILFYDINTKTRANVGNVGFEPTYNNSNKYFSFTVDGDRLIIPRDGSLYFYNIAVNNGVVSIPDIRTKSKRVPIAGSTNYRNNSMISSGKDGKGYWTMLDDNSTNYGYSYKVNENGRVKDHTKLSTKSSETWLAGLSLVDKGNGKVLGTFEGVDYGFLEYIDKELRNKAVKGFTDTDTDGKVNSKYTYISNHPDPDKIWISRRGGKDIYLVQTKDNWASANYLTMGGVNFPLKTRQQFFKDNGFTD